MRSHMILAAVVVLISTLASPVLAEDAPTKDGSTARWMIKQERAWANMACGGKWIPLDTFADDFQGTLPKGTHYGRPKSIPTYAPDTQWSTDCQLDSADVRFFSADVAVVYGAESNMAVLPNSKHQKHCLAWTDIWLKRKGKWQIIAAQDNRIECPAK